MDEQWLTKKKESKLDERKKESKEKKKKKTSKERERKISMKRGSWLRQKNRNKQELEREI